MASVDGINCHGLNHVLSCDSDAPPEMTVTVGASPLSLPVGTVQSQSSDMITPDVCLNVVHVNAGMVAVDVDTAVVDVDEDMGAVSLQKESGGLDKSGPLCLTKPP